ncbi:hypothetical protein CXF87_10140 [Halomonas sp. MES3-P3E]|nr:hypothetical protein CXF87_10140 [Halomonas sp. MES3-P3E]
MIGWACPVSHNLNFSNRPVRTRMPGGVAGDRSAMLTAPMPIVFSHCGGDVAPIPQQLWLSTLARSFPIDFLHWLHS